ncbi:aldo/keto reductase [Natronorubrum texcoconense]|uniref:2,5-diketo-D-gluconate reductase B n=1 Tax=Natronorubrum texcoconense TaxID=1095776 RepID=A0A1G8TC08_9EURY|nr:aldo/keto reductase [Natronorubrum texcoconense]SDJ39038.1 2,5-diketo-D-gluconate reductase B [Natronorubrum texcoconense]
MDAPPLELPSVGLGTMGIDDPAVIETALELGYRHLDTAQIYENEAVVGEGLARALESNVVDRDDVTVATKVWADSLAPEDVRRTTCESLERLGLETVDLLYVHRPIDTYDPETTLPAFDDLVADGLVGHVGVSNFTVDELERARGILDSPIAAHQAEYHPLFQSEELLEQAREHGSPLVGYAPLSGGRVRDVEAVASVAAKHETTPEAVAIAWLVAKEGVVTIPKASSRSHLAANLEAVELELESEDIGRIDALEREEELFPE